MTAAWKLLEKFLMPFAKNLYIFHPTYEFSCKFLKLHQTNKLFLKVKEHFVSFEKLLYGTNRKSRYFRFRYLLTSSNITGRAGSQPMF